MAGTTSAATPSGWAVGVLFYLAPLALLLAALGLRTAGVVESEEAVAERVLAFEAEARRAAADEGLDLPLLLAVATVESAGRPAARSHRGAVGLMQLMPATAEEVSGRLGLEGVQLTDPAVSLRLGARYLSEQIARFGAYTCATELGLAAYNAGPAKVLSWVEESPPPEDCAAVAGWVRYRETRGFVQRVRRWRVVYAERLGSR